jgi:hypothetical protein
VLRTLKNVLDTQKAKKKESCRYARKETANGVAFTDMEVSRPMKKNSKKRRNVLAQWKLKKRSRHAEGEDKGELPPQKEGIGDGRKDVLAKFKKTHDARKRLSPSSEGFTRRRKRSCSGLPVVAARLEQKNERKEGKRN